MLTTNRGRVRTHRLRRKADEFSRDWLDNNELVSIPTFVEAMKDYYCHDTIFKSVTFKDDVLKRFRAYLGNPKRAEEIHIHDLFIEFQNAVDGKQTI